MESKREGRESKRPFEVAPQRNYSFGEMKHFPREKERERVSAARGGEWRGVAAFFNANKIAAFRPRAWYQTPARMLEKQILVHLKSSPNGKNPN